MRNLSSTPRARTRHRGALAAAALGLLSALLPAACGPPPPARNLLILCIDTLRADHLGAYGYDRDTSPRIDALATQGTLFENASAQAPWTVPATASLLTSLYPSQHGAEVEGEVKQLGETPPNQLRAGVATLGQILKNDGLHTALLSANPYLYGRFKRGFDLAVVERQDAGRLTGTALEWLRQNRDQRWFLYMQFMDLHQPIEPPEPYFSMFPAGAGGERLPTHTDWRYPRLEDPTDPDFQRFRDHKVALYDGALRYVDAQIGRIVDTLRELDLLDDTLVVITADHGEEFWDHWEIGRLLGHDPRGIWGIGHGHSMFNELLHVPLILRGPSVASGRRSDCPVRHLDVAPTALEQLALSPEPVMRGISLQRWIAPGGGGDACPDLPQIAESPAYGPDSRAVTWRGRKLIERADGVRMLFDLREDPGERHNRIGQEPVAAEALTGILERELATGERQPPSERMEFDPETEAQLRALGYL